MTAPRERAPHGGSPQASASDPSLLRLRQVVEGALAHLESRRAEINDLNVFPVADGDTGDNMALTLRAVLTEMDSLAAGGRALDDLGRAEIVDSVARAALLGARGNSGVILSQLIRGAAEELISRPGELVDPILVCAAMGRAAQRAYASVRVPAEGTMLTVMREMAAAVASEIAHLPARQTRVEPGETAERQDELVAAILERAIVAGEEAVRRGPELLPALREAGVVDAGGYAVTVIFAGVVAALRGGVAPELAPVAGGTGSLGAAGASGPKVSHPEHEDSQFQFCTNFAISGRDLEAAPWVPQLEELGDSVLVVGDARTLKIHVHTDDPDRATALFDGVGELSHVEIADMREQVARRAERLAAGAHAAPAGPPGKSGVVAVVSGAGLATLFAQLGCDVLDGGPTMNPSTTEILAAVAAVRAEEVVVLPNSSNVVMAAERAAALSEKQVVVLPSATQQGGLAAAVGFVAGDGAQDNAQRMGRALAQVRTGGVASAARDDPGGRFVEGDALGYVGSELVAHGTPAGALAGVLGKLGAEAELLTVIRGAGAPLDAAASAALAPEGPEIEWEEGGQPAWWWLVAAE